MSRFANVVLVSGAVAAILLVGALIGGLTVFTHYRLGTLELRQTETVTSLNQTVLPEVDRRLGVLETKKDKLK